MTGPHACVSRSRMSSVPKPSVIYLLSLCLPVQPHFPVATTNRKLRLIPPTQPLIQPIAYAVSSLFLAFSYAFLNTQMLSPLQGFNQSPYSIP